MTSIGFDKDTIMKRKISINQSKFGNVKNFVISHKTKLIPLVLVVLFILGIVKARMNANTSDVEAAGSPIEINQQVQLRAQNEDGDILKQSFDITILNAQRQQRVLAKGQWLRARNGKVFLVITMDMKNSLPATLYAEPVDWIRLIEGDKKIAPTAHQGMVEVRAQSTKETNVAFVVNENEKKFTLEIGGAYGIDQVQTLELEF